MNLDALLAEVKRLPAKRGAGPVRQHGRWTALWEAYSGLRSRHYSCQEAVDWLVSKGVIPKGDKERALAGFHMIATRKNRREKATA